jgi:hypothetical protein
MEKSYVKGVANHTGPESCGTAREGGDEALTGESTGRVSSGVRNSLRDADAVRRSGRHHSGHLISNTDSTFIVYSRMHIRVKAYTRMGPKQRF